MLPMLGEGGEIAFATTNHQQLESNGAPVGIRMLFSLFRSVVALCVFHPMPPFHLTLFCKTYWTLDVIRR